jgi:hypothetical protein
MKSAELESCSGIPSGNRFLIVMPAWATKRFNQPMRGNSACPYDSCRLAINLYSYVNDPFSPKAVFDFEKFRKHIHTAQRMMDDIIDLELEKIDAILDKINRDPEDPELKRVEKKLWENIRVKAEEGRRTGIGITAEGDMLAALGLRYGSETLLISRLKFRKRWLLRLTGHRLKWPENADHLPFTMPTWKRTTRLYCG